MKELSNFENGEGQIPVEVGKDSVMNKEEFDKFLGRMEIINQLIREGAVNIEYKKDEMGKVETILVKDPLTGEILLSENQKTVAQMEKDTGELYPDDALDVAAQRKMQEEDSIMPRPESIN